MNMKSTSFIVSVGVGVIMLLLAWFGILSPLGEISALRSARTDAQVSAQIKQQQLQNLASTKSNLDTLLAKEKGLTGLFWQRTNQLALLTTLEQTASSAGVQSEVTLSDIPAGTDAIEVPITLTVRGTWPAVLAELRALEKLRPLLFVDSVNVQASGANAVSASITAKTLWL